MLVDNYSIHIVQQGVLVYQAESGQFAHEALILLVHFGPPAYLEGLHAAVLPQVGLFLPDFSEHLHDVAEVVEGIALVYDYFD